MRALSLRALTMTVVLTGSVNAAQAEPAPDDPVARAAQGSPLPSLSALIARVRERAPDVVVGRARVRASRSAYVGARRAPLENPYLEVTGERATNRSQEVAVNGTLWLPFEVNGQRGSRLREADAYVALNQADLDHVKTLAVAEGVRAYGRTVVAAGRVRVLEEIVNSSQREAEMYRARVDSGDSTRADAKLAEVEFARSRVLLEESRADLDAALAHVEQLLDASFSEVRAPPEPPAQHELLARDTLQSYPLLARLRSEAKYFASVKERASREGRAPVSLMLLGGRGELGEARVGAGLAYAFPVFRYNQGERAQAEGERQRVLTELRVREKLLKARVQGLLREISRVRRAARLLENDAIPAAREAVEAAVATHQVGKKDLLSVLVTRRDLALLRLRALELAEREWLALGDLVELTGAR